MLSRKSLTVVIKFVLRVRFIGFVALLLLWSEPEIQAAVINVDSGCTLAQAITEANGWTNNTGSCEAGTDPGGGNDGDDTIILSADITLTSDLPLIISNITIDGSDGSGGRYTISGDGQYGLIYHDHNTLRLQNLILSNGITNTLYGSIYSDSNSSLTIHNTVIQNSDISDVSGSKGGGVYKDGRGALTITQSVISGNKAGLGGGVYSESPTTISRSAIYNNSAGSGGGAYFLGEDRSFAVTNSTVYGNAATSAGGGLYTGDAASVDLKHVTIVKNSAAADSAGGVYLTTGRARIDALNNILFDNSNGDCKLVADEDFSGTGGGVVVNANIIGANECSGTNLSDNPQLSASATGDIPYFPFSTTSPAIDAADCLEGVNVDQIGTTRPQGSRCDIGAYEGPGTFVIATDTATATSTATPTGSPTAISTATPTGSPDPTATSAPKPIRKPPDEAPTAVPPTPTSDRPTPTPSPTPQPAVCNPNDRISVRSFHHDVECEAIDMIALDKHPALQGGRLAVRVWRSNRQCTHRVAGGENLFRLTLRYNTSVEALRRHNYLKSALIRAGQELSLPVCPQQMKGLGQTWICFKATGALVFIDTTRSPAADFTLPSFVQDEYTCAMMYRPGTVVLTDLR